MEFENKVLVIVNISSNNVDSVSQIQSLQQLKIDIGDELEILAFPCRQFNAENRNYQQLRDLYKDINFKVF